MSEIKIYTPELLPRDGEIYAWLLSIVAALGLFFLSLRAGIPYWAWFLFIIFLFSAFSMTLGNWMDRKTHLEISPEGLRYENGLRKTSITWENLQEVRTAPARWGTSVQVIGTNGHFSYSTLGEMQFQGQIRGKTGFIAGEEILDVIIPNSLLKKNVSSGQFSTYLRH